MFITDDLFGSFDHLQDLLLFRFAQRLDYHWGSVAATTAAAAAAAVTTRNSRTIRQLLMLLLMCRSGQCWTIDLFRLDRPTRIQSVSKEEE